MKGIYLASFRANHPNYDIVYQDINGKRDIGGDMMGVDLEQYDFIIATPPCNYYSRANYRRETSEYSQLTKHLLPDIIDKLIELDKPFIVENVLANRLFNEIKLFNRKCFYLVHGRHTYWTNIPFNPTGIYQGFDFEYGDKFIGNMNNLCKNDRQGGLNVHNVIEHWLEIIHSTPKIAP